jgi:LPXTG-site transpeptidase (sortase) family protein
MNKPISEEDLLKLFLKKQKSTNIVDLTFNFAGKTIAFLAVLFVVFIGINYYAIKDNFSYWYKNDFQETNQPNIDNQAGLQPSASMLKNINSVNGKKIQDGKINIPQITDNSISIPILNLSAPVSWRINNTSKEVSSSLEKGVIQVNGTALPGEKGNVYITGHSSNYVWTTGDYKSIFSVISRLAAGDLVYINYGGTTYIYKVYDQKIVAKDDLSIMQKTSDSKLSLVTCWPLGTSLKRMVVLANQIYPDPIKNKASENNSGFNQLPSGR